MGAFSEIDAMLNEGIAFDYDVVTGPGLFGGAVTEVRSAENGSIKRVFRGEAERETHARGIAWRAARRRRDARKARQELGIALLDDALTHG